jgi:mRNA interferase MazF
VDINRGDIFFVDLEPVKGSEQGKVRPCLIIQNNIGNKYSPTTIISAITSKGDDSYPFLVKVDKGIANLSKNSFIQLNQIRTISKERIIKKIGNLPKKYLKKVDYALKKSLDLE